MDKIILLVYRLQELNAKRLEVEVKLQILNGELDALHHEAKITRVAHTEAVENFIRNVKK